MLEQKISSPQTSLRRSANVAIVSVNDALGRWGLSVDALTAAAIGVSLYPISAGVGGISEASDTHLMSPDDLLLHFSRTLATQPIDVIKLGYLLDASAVDAITDALVEIRGPKPDPSAAPVVLDPVLFDQAGMELASVLTGPAYVRRLLPLATVVTPNALEASVLVGFPVGDRSSMKDACKALFDRGVLYPLVVAHLERHSIDIAYDGTGFVEFGVDKLPIRAYGSGCAHSTAIAAFLAQGIEPLEAFDRAKKLVTRAVKEALSRSDVLRVVNPMCDLYATAEMEVSRYETTSESPGERDA